MDGQVSALHWHARMKHAPQLAHTVGLVCVQLDERVVMFPSEADARFFVAAYTDVPALAAQVATLRQQIDEGALNKALNRASELEAENAKLKGEIAKLSERLAAEANRRAVVTRHARVMAAALKGRQ